MNLKASLSEAELAALGELGREVRHALMRVPATCAAACSLEDNAASIEIIIETELLKALRSVARPSEASQ